MGNSSWQQCSKSLFFFLSLSLIYEIAKESSTLDFENYLFKSNIRNLASRENKRRGEEVYYREEI